jgi:hypothetical protein
MKFANRLSIAALLCLVLAGPAARATETDNFFAWGRPELRDSIEPFNKKINADLEAVLRRINRRHAGDALACDEVARAFSSHFFFFVGKDWPELWGETSARVDRYPNAATEEEYKKNYIYGPYIPWDWGIAPGIAPTLRLNGVNLGADKLGHFFVVSWRYYEVYKQALKDGLDPVTAEKRAIDLGVHLEKTSLGLQTTGVFSYGDLEANYQGLRFYQQLCSGDSPQLARTAEGWALKRPFDGRKYIDLDFDESVNTSGYTVYRWNRVKKRLVRYCSRLNDPAVVAIKKRYAEERTRLAASNLSRSYADELVRKGGAPDPRIWSLETLCASR